MIDRTKQIKELPEVHKIRGLNLDKIKPIRKQQLMEIIEAVKKDPSLDLQIRDGYLNIYYRGGNLLKVSSFRGRNINFSFDVEYFKRKNGKHLDDACVTEAPSNVSYWVNNIATLKEIMDGWFKDYEKAEREGQHIHTSASTRDPSSPWIMLDIEYAAWLYGQRENRTVGRRLCRFDMIALERTNLSALGPLKVYIVEFKQGLGAVHGRAGVIDHAQDLKQFIAGDCKDDKARDAFKQSVLNILVEKIALGLLPGVKLPPANIEIELKALFLFKHVNLQNIQDLQMEAEKILVGHSAMPLFRGVSELFN